MPDGATVTAGLFGSKNKSFNDERSRQAWFGNIDQANSLPGFQGFTPGLLSQFQDPYQDQAIRGAMGDLEYQRQLAGNTTGDAAQAAGAFGGSRHGVADALTNEGFARQGSMMSSQMRSQGFAQALQAAMMQLGMQNQYGLQRQGAINQAVSLLRPNTKGTNLGGSYEQSISFSGAGGGGGG